MREHKHRITKWYVLESNALDDRLELYEFTSRHAEQGDVFEEISEELHSYSSILLMDQERLNNLFMAVDTIRQTILAKRGDKRRKK